MRGCWSCGCVFTLDPVECVAQLSYFPVSAFTAFVLNALLGALKYVEYVDSNTLV